MNVVQEFATTSSVVPTAFSISPSVRCTHLRLP